ncbi:hypothetical protein Q4560_11630 [Celeribacter halophilus]|uniref:Uncharacterized protein n=1 Tax=Celeribacter halophilus TaxID=576117 RepID=A0AAW7XXH5_9RHOB|nr:hypothetical protein [Celeribacter halophilus]MDO6457657.1 hypothetical protein [Celeribacter halophilus]MDO6723915.1 hypothetical protein [Celeribacter halophilus]
MAVPTAHYSPYDRFKYWGEEDACRMRQNAVNSCSLVIALNVTIAISRAFHRQPANHAQRDARDGKPQYRPLQHRRDGAYPPHTTGFYEFTGDPADMGRFRTPSLRNVAATAPYFHDGSAETLEDVLALDARKHPKLQETDTHAIEKQTRRPSL